MAYQAKAKIQFNKQGATKGTSPKKGDEAYFEIISFSTGITAPTDVNSGGYSGKAVLTGVRITKQLDANSPMFLQAIATNEFIDSVTIKLVKQLKAGGEQEYYTVELGKGAIQSVFVETGDPRFNSGTSSKGGPTNVNQHGNPGSHNDTFELETITIMCTEMAHTHDDKDKNGSKTSYKYSWEQTAV